MEKVLGYGTVSIMASTTSSTHKEIDDILSRGVSLCIDPHQSLRNKLIGKVSGTYKKDIVIKFGVDPTRPDIHIGHAVILRALRRFQDLGCKVVFLVGDFTAQIGDPTGKSKVRPEIAFAEIEANMKTYLDQVGKILRTDLDVFTWIRNSDWFFGMSDIAPDPSRKVTMSIEQGGKKIDAEIPVGTAQWKAAIFEESRMQKKVSPNNVLHEVSLRGFLWTLRQLTHSRLIERDMFSDRIKKGEELFLHEMMYPVLQGIDSHLIASIYGTCDLEVGGSDQTFNMVMGRDVMKMNGEEPQAVMAFSLLRGTDGIEKMSKSLDNYVGITDEAGDMYGKIMSIPDSCIEEYFTLCTYTPQEDIQLIAQKIADPKNNPRDFKARLAREVVAIYHGEKVASEASDRFVKTFRSGSMPDDAPIINTTKGSVLSDVLYGAKVVESKSEWYRLVKAGAVSFVSKSGERLTDEKATVEGAMDLRIGKHRFVRIKIDETA
jgi:tyrosyl-tRNA synthetase